MKVYLLGFNPHSAIQHFTIAHLFYSQVEIIPLQKSREIPQEVLNSPDAIILFLQASLRIFQQYNQIEKIFKEKDRNSRAKFVWVPFDRYSEYLFELLQIYHRKALPRVTDSQPILFPDYYYYNHRLKKYILEPHCIPFAPNEIEQIMSSTKYLPVDLAICHSPLMAHDLAKHGIKTQHLNYPSTTMGSYMYHPANRIAWSKLLFVTYDGSVPTDELAKEENFQNILNQIDKVSGYLRIQQWSSSSKLIHPRSNAILSYRRGSIIRRGSSKICTIEQRWGAAAKLNVAARAGVPLLGFWQDSYDFYSGDYPFLEIGSDYYYQYLDSEDYREYILDECKKYSTSFLTPATPHRWSESVISFLTEISA